MAQLGWSGMLQIGITKKYVYSMTLPSLLVVGGYIKFLEVQPVYGVLKEATLRVSKDVCSSSEVVLKNEEASLKCF
jgi:hypothetical protein